MGVTNFGQYQVWPDFVFKVGEEGGRGGFRGPGGPGRGLSGSVWSGWGAVRVGGPKGEEGDPNPEKVGALRVGPQRVGPRGKPPVLLSTA